MASGNAAVVHRVIDEVLNAGNLDSADELIAADVVNHNTVPGLPANREGAKEIFRKLRGAFPDLRFAAEEIIEHDDKVVVRWSGRGTHTGKFVFLEPTNREVTVSGIDIVRIAGGKIVERWGYYDQIAILRQLDLLDTPGAS